MKKYPAQPLDLMQYVNTKYHEPFIRELIETENGLDANRLADAVAKLANAFPLLKCRYEVAANEFVENEDFSVGDLLERDDDADRTTLLTRSLDTDRRLILFTLSENSLIVTVSHLVCDGSGFKSLLYLLCEFYNGKSDGDFSYLMNRDFSQVAENLTCGAGTTLKMLCSVLGGYKNQRIYDKIEGEKVCLAEKTADAESMAKIHAAAKKQGATLNDVFLTAYARAIGKLYRRKKINIPCTVDLRKYAQKKAGVANLTGTYNLNVKIDVRRTFAESLRDVAEKMQKQKRTKNDVVGPMLLVSKYRKTTLERFLKLYGGMDTSPLTDYTNLGAIDEKKLSFRGATVTNAVGYGGLNKAPYFSIAVSTFKGKAVVSGLFACGESESKKAALLVDTVIEETLSFIQGRAIHD